MGQVLIFVLFFPFTPNTPEASIHTDTILIVFSIYAKEVFAKISPFDNVPSEVFEHAYFHEGNVHPLWDVLYVVSVCKNVIY